jgi:hypothetical protein
MEVKQKHANPAESMKNGLQTCLQKNRRAILIVFFAIILAFVLLHMTPSVNIHSQHLDIKE